MTNRGIGDSTRTMAIATFVSRALGFAKSTLLVLAIGGTSASVGGQTFDVANSAPTFLYGLIAGGVLGAILVPQIVRAIAEGDEGRRQLERLLTLALLGAVVVTVALTLAAPFIVRLYAVGWPTDWLNLATVMAYWTLPQVFFFIFYTVAAQLLNAHSRFTAAAWAPALSNVVAIAGLAFFLIALPSGLGSTESWNATMVAVLCGTATLGIALQGVVLLIPLRRLGLRLRPRLGAAGLGATSRIAGWTFGGLLAGQLAYLVIANVANSAGERLNAAGINGASLNSLSYAYLLLLLPHGVLTVSLATAMYTRMSHAAAGARFDELAGNVQQTTALVRYISLAATAGFIVLGPTFTDLLWGTPIIGEVLRALTLGLLGFSQAYIVNRALYALQDGFRPFLNQVTAAGTTILGSLIVALWLPIEYAVEYIAVVIAVSNTLSWWMASRALSGHLRRAGVQQPGTTSNSMAALPSGIAMLASVLLGLGALTITNALITGLLIPLLITAGVVLVSYAACARLLGDHSLRQILRR